MPTYWIEGSLTYHVKVEVEAESPEQALKLAESDDWERVVEEGRWKDAYNFEPLDGLESVHEEEDDPDVDEDTHGGND